MASAMRLDLETDDPRAEVARLTAIGAFSVISPGTPGWPQGTKVVAGPTSSGP